MKTVTDECKKNTVLTRRITDKQKRYVITQRSQNSLLPIAALTKWIEIAL